MSSLLVACVNVTGSRGNPTGAQLTVGCRRSAIRAAQEGKERGYGMVVRITYGRTKGGLHLITSI
jgi:hypothetical protein